MSTSVTYSASLRVKLNEASAIVGTTKPDRIHENTAIVKAGPLPKDLFEKIRSRWHAVADSTWVGET